MNPVTGPFIWTETVLGLPTAAGFRPDKIRRRRVSYRQRRPYNLPLAFTYEHEEVLTSSCINDDTWYTLPSGDHGIFYGADVSTLGPNAYNKAYERFKSISIPASAGWGVNISQKQQALDMIQKRALQILRFSKAVRKRDFTEAARLLGVIEPSRRKQKKMRKNTYADNFLEYNFGWAPLIGDVYSSVEVLQGGVPPQRVNASATEVLNFKFNNLSSNPGYSHEWSGSETYSWRISADLSVTNPNLHLAEQLGLVNPAAILFDMIPFSFVADWFVNISDFVESFTDFAGVTFVNSSVTCHRVRRTTRIGTQHNWPQNGQHTLYDTSTYIRVETVRAPGSIPGPTLRVRPPWRLAPQRAASAVSLLLQQLAKQ